MRLEPDAIDDRNAGGRVAQARAAMPVTAHCRYLNTGSMGPVSTVLAGTLERITREDLSRGRAVTQRYALLDAAREDLRNEVAALAQADPAQLALTQSTTQGLARVIDGMSWNAGDEILTTDLEYSSCAAALRRAADRFDLRLRVAKINARAVFDAETRDSLVGPRTRLAVLSAVAFESGARLPLEDVIETARRHGALTLVDAAQCIGASPLDLTALGVDFCAMPLQKWLCGPEGLGALYVRGGTLGGLFGGERDSVVQSHAVLAAAAEQMRWQRETLGWDWIVSRTASLAVHLRDSLRPLPGLSLLTPDAPTGLTTIAIEAADPAEVFDTLTSSGFVVRYLPALAALRISTAYFNCRAELDELVELITECVAE